MNYAEMNTEKLPIKIVFDGYTVDQTVCDFYTVSIETGCISDGYASIGTTFSPTCSVRMSYTEVAYAGVIFEIFFEINDVWVNFGVFKLTDEPKEETDGVISFVGNGMLSTVCESISMTFTHLEMRDGLSYADAALKFTQQTGIEVVFSGSPSYLNTPGTVKVPAYDRSADEESKWTNISLPAREFIGGVALLLGCVVVERNGKLYMKSLASYSLSGNVFNETTYTEMEFTKITYMPSPITITYQPIKKLTHSDTPYFTYISGEKEAISRNPPTNKSPTKYQLTIECDWVGASLQGESHFDSGIEYNPCTCEFPGYNAELICGNAIRVIKGETELRVACLEVSYEWDGGLITKISSSFSGSATEGNSTQIASTISVDARKANEIGIENDVRAFKSVYADYIKANDARINNLESISITTENLTAEVAELGYLKADAAELEYASIDTLEAAVAYIEELEAIAITTENLSASVATLGYLKVDDAELEYADIALANVEKASVATLFANVGLLDRATIVDGHVTGFLDAVEVNAANITAGTLVADRILLRGSESGLLYALNNMGELESTKVNTLDGGVITKRTITADHIAAGSITANEIDVEDLFAQDITAAGTITGATLTGASGSFTGKITANSGSIGDWNIQNREFWYSKTVDGHAYLSGLGGLNFDMQRDKVTKFRVNMSGELLNSVNSNCLYANLGYVRLLSDGDAAMVAQGGVDINCNGTMRLGASATSLYIGKSAGTIYAGGGNGSIRAGKFMRSSSLYAPMTNISNMIMKTGTFNVTTTTSNFFTLAHNCGFANTNYFVWVECSNVYIAVLRVQNIDGNTTSVWANTADGAYLPSGTYLTLRWFAVGTG